MKFTIACDVDGVLADIHKVWLEWYNRDYKDDLQVSDIRSWDMHKWVRPQCGKEIYKYLTSEMYDYTQPFTGAQKFVSQVKELGRVIFVTSSVEKTFGRKYKWLKDFGFIDNMNDYVECSDKGLVRASVLIDDYHENLYKFTGRKILVSSPWNESEQEKCKTIGIDIVSSFDETLEVLRKYAKSFGD